eukprot:UN07839
MQIQLLNIEYIWNATRFKGLDEFSFSYFILTGQLYIGAQLNVHCTWRVSPGAKPHPANLKVEAIIFQPNSMYQTFVPRNTFNIVDYHNEPTSILIVPSESVVANALSPQSPMVIQDKADFVSTSSFRSE